MKKHSSLRGAFALAATLMGVACATPAQATMVYVTYTGTMSGVDTLGYFGAAGSTIRDLDYTASYVFNVDYSLSHNSEVGNGTSSPQNLIGGGTTYGGSQISPAVSGVFAAGVASFTISGDYYGYIYGYNNGSTSQQTHDIRGPDYSGIRFYNTIYNNLGSLPAAIVTTLEYNVINSDSSNGFFCEASGAYCLGLVPQYLSISLTPPEQAPIPGALPLFVSGLGAIGLFSWRRKRGVKSAA